MKKMKFLKTLTFLYLFSLFSCSEDFYENTINRNDIKVSHKKFENLLKDKKFSKVLTEVIVNKNKISSNSRTIMEQQYGFNITNQPVNVIENDSITSYTLFVTRENTPSNVIENLIIQTNNNNPNDTKAFLIKYTSNVDINENFDMSNFQGTKSILPIIYNINESDTTGKLVYVETCWNVTSWYCYGPGGHSTSEGCTMGFPITSQNCMTTSYDDGTGSGGGGGTSSGSGGTSSGDVFTAPHGGGSGGNEAISTLNDDCSSLMKMNTVSRNKLKSLKIDAINGNDGGEYGLSFKHDASGNCLQPVDLQHSPKLLINIPFGNNIYGAAHTHPQSALPMFSFSDVLTLQKLYSQCDPEYSADVVFMLLNNDGSAYAIKVNNLQALKQLTNNYLTETKMIGRQEQIKKADEAFGRYLKNSTNLERGFLEFFPSNALSMYRVTGDFTGYTKLSLPENTSSSIIDKTPCN